MTGMALTAMPYADMLGTYAVQVEALEGDLTSLRMDLKRQESEAVRERAEHAEACAALHASLLADRAAALTELAEEHRCQLEEQASVATVQQEAAAAQHAASMKEAHRAAAELGARLEMRTEELEEHVTALQMQLEHRCVSMLRFVRSTS